MSIIAIIIILILIFVIAYFLKKKNRSDITPVVSTKDNSTYHVKTGSDQDKAVSMLEEVRRRINLLEAYLEQNINKYPEYRPYIEQLLQRGRNIKLNENPPDGKLTSFTVNKGEEMSLCLRSKKDGQLHDINLVMYVVLHELAHVACPEEQHTKLFKKIFVFFLVIGTQIGIYRPIPFDTHPLEYCGMQISENLLKNANLKG